MSFFSTHILDQQNSIICHSQPGPEKQYGFQSLDYALNWHAFDLESAQFLFWYNAMIG